MRHERFRARIAFTLVLGAALALVITDAATAGPKAPDYGGMKVSKKEAAQIELGRRLFFDPLVSRSGERSCASCHDPDHGFSDPAMVSEDDIGNTVRHSQTILDSHLNPTAHWDGEFTSIEALVTARIGLPQGIKGLQSHGAPLSGGVSVVGTGEATPAIGTGGERRRPGGGGGYGPPPSSPPPPTGDAPPRRGDDTPSDDDRDDRPITRSEPFDVKRLAELPRVQDVLEAGGRYASAFKTAFGNESVTTARIAKAIAIYCRSVRSTEAPFDRYLDGDRSALSESAQRGYKLFRGKAGCVKCHALTNKDAARTPLTDFDFHNSGIAWLDLPDAQKRKLRKSDEFRILDRGRERISRRGRDLRAFKTGTLRDLTRRGPYMHTGVFTTLDEVVRYYAAGGSDDPRQDKLLRKFEVSDSEVADLVAFLESLTGAERPGLAPVAWAARPTTTRLRFVDAGGKPISGVDVALHPVGDVLPGVTARTETNVVRRTTDEKGWIEYLPPFRTHMRVRISSNLMTSGGELVPDTCDKATIKVPVHGKTVLMLRVPKSKPAPKVLAVDHLGTLVLPGHGRPQSRLSKGQELVTGDVRTVRYEGWFRTDVGNEVVVRIPGERAHTERDLTVKLLRDKPVTLDLTP